jgi:tetratricopeptide (TPR) repeat protein
MLVMGQRRGGWKGFSARLAGRAAVVGVLSCATAAVAAVDSSGAERFLMQGRADAAVAMLRSGSLDGQGHLLLCRAYYAEGLADEAVGECEASLRTMGGSSEAQDWMGRAYGLKASEAGMLSGFSLARRVKAAFEAAVQLDPQNGAAANDLSEYYVGAPSLVGGGLDRADALAKQVEGRLPQQAHRMRGLAAEKRGDFHTAEGEFRLAVGVAGRPDAWADLGAFYFRREQVDKAVDALQQCVAADWARDASLVDAASLLKDHHREAELSVRWLRDYLGGGRLSDAAPAFKVRVELGELLEQQGDRAGAKIEFGEALQMVSNYGPAQRDLQSL